jgi:hypothetical protein
MTSAMPQTLVTEEMFEAYKRLLEGLSLRSIETPLYAVQSHDPGLAGYIQNDPSNVFIEYAHRLQSNASEIQDGGNADERTMLIGGLEFDVNLTYKGALAATIRCSLVGFYTSKGGVPDATTLQIFQEDLIPVQLFPYARPLVHQGTSLLGIPPMTVPLIITPRVGPGSQIGIPIPGDTDSNG